MSMRAPDKPEAQAIAAPRFGVAGNEAPPALPSRAELARVEDLVRRALLHVGLLEAYGDVRNAPTEVELWVGCKDAAPLMLEMAAALRSLLARVEELEQQAVIMNEVLDREFSTGPSTPPAPGGDHEGKATT